MGTAQPRSSDVIGGGCSRWLPPGLAAILCLAAFLAQVDASYHSPSAARHPPLLREHLSRMQRLLSPNPTAPPLASLQEDALPPSPVSLLLLLLGFLARLLPARSSPPTPTPASAGTSRVYHVTDYGADPTGKADSTDAISRAVADAFRAPSPGRTLLSGIVDLGGAELNLDGGAYLVSRPIRLPSSGGGNFKIHGGSLRAADDFPADRYLIELWAAAPSSAASSSLDYEYVTLRDLMLDANYRGGGMAVVDSLRTTVDNCYVVHFATDGILVRGGHETYIHNSYLGQHITAGGDPGERNFTGVGINLDGNDNAVTDVVIFSAATGVLVSGQANTLTGVHCYNKATAWGGVGIYLRLPRLTQTRVVNCYLDYTSIVAEDPVQLVVTGSFFLGDANVVLRSVKGVMQGVTIVDNIFSGRGGGVRIVQLDESAGAFEAAEQVVVEGNAVAGMAARATSARGSARGNGTSWAVDFSPVLLFPDRIDHVQYTLVADEAAAMFVGHAVRNVSGNRVVVESQLPVSATVHVSVDQSGGAAG